MAASKTRTIKNKHAAPKGASSKTGGSTGGKRSATDGISKSKKPKGPVVSQQVKEKNRAALLKKPKKKVYTEAELGIPTLNMVTPVGVVKPKGKKKGKVFVDDEVRSLSPMAFDSFEINEWSGEHGDHHGNSSSRKERRDRVENDQGKADGRDQGVAQARS